MKHLFAVLFVVCILPVLLLAQTRRHESVQWFFDNGASLGPIHHVILCGDLPSSATAYSSPVSGYAGGALFAAGLTANDLGYGIAGTGCAAEDNATEATADEVMFANNPFRVMGLYCAVTGSGSNGVTINLRSAAANLSPDVAVTIPTGETTAVADLREMPVVAAGATFATRQITTEDLSAQDFWCMATIQIIRVP